MAGLVVWVTGLPSSGKSTLAEALAAELRARGQSVSLLDGDRVRACISPTPGYDASSRDDFYTTLARLSALLAEQDQLVLVSATANLRSYRERARAISPAYFEIFVDTPLEVCRARDTKGLYAQSERGALPDVPGAGVGYERPISPEWVVAGELTPEGLRALTSALVKAASANPTLH